MPTIPIRPQKSSGSLCRKVGLLSVAGTLVLIAGCASQRRPKFRLADAALARPVMPAENPSSDANAVAPEIQVDGGNLPALSVVRSLPARPHVPTPVNPQPSRAGKALDPMIAPELTTEELSIAKADAQRSFDTVDRNLALAQSKRLSLAQADLVSQIRGFEQSARDASREGDWSRARNLAKKAEVLSQELVGTF
jgi:hypothetical protein